MLHHMHVWKRKGKGKGAYLLSGYPWEFSGLYTSYLRGILRMTVYVPSGTVIRETHWIFYNYSVLNVSWKHIIVLLLQNIWNITGVLLGHNIIYRVYSLRSLFCLGCMAEWYGIGPERKRSGVRFQAHLSYIEALGKLWICIASCHPVVMDT
jgi:hypothetical protein